MADFYKDSHGASWGVMKQEREYSCGPACAAMAEVYYKQKTVANLEGRVRALSQKYPGRFRDGVGTSMDNLVEVLRDEGVKTYDVVRTDRVWAYLYKYANDNTPVIVEIDWITGAKHLVLCPYVYKSDWHCIFLDPRPGLIELTGPSLPAFRLVQNSSPVGTLSGQIIITHL
jgi:hypothetical protein